MPIDAALLASIKANDPVLVALDLKNKKLTDSDIQPLAEALTQNTTLTTLNLNDNHIGATGAKHVALALKDNITLTTLGLGCNNIRDTGAKDMALALKDNTTLTTLDLSVNHIGATGAEHIALALQANTTLTTLHLYINNIGATGAQAMARALQDNTTLTTLHLSYNGIEATGAQDITRALKANTTLTTLNLGGNGIEVELLKALGHAIKHNQQQKAQHILQRRDQLIQTLITLARDGANPHSQSFWSWLPKELRLHVISFIHFRANESIGKSAKQLYQCAAFIFHHVAELKASLAESVKTQQAFKIWEKIVQGNSQFRFFPTRSQHSIFHASKKIEEKTKQENRSNYETTHSKNKNCLVM